MKAKTIKDICLEYGYSQTALAKRFGVPLRTVQNWHGGQREPAPYVVPMMEEILQAEQAGGADTVQNIFDEVENLLDENECMVGAGAYYFGSLKHSIEELKKKYHP